MSRLFFSSTNAAIQYLSNYTGKRVIVAGYHDESENEALALLGHPDFKGEAWDLYMSISEDMTKAFPNSSYNGPKTMEATQWIINKLKDHYVDKEKKLTEKEWYFLEGYLHLPIGDGLT